MKIKKNLAVSDTGFIFDPTSGDSYSLNPIGAEIVNMLKENKSEQEIEKYILGKYDVDKSTYEKAYMDFVNMIKQYQLAESDEK